MTPARGALILVADDDGDVRELVVFRLERAGYRVVTAADGQEAVEVALERSPDVCVIDVMMPKLDGYQVTERLRASPGLAEVPIVPVEPGLGDHDADLPPLVHARKRRR